MGLKTAKPVTEGQRFRVSLDFAELTKNKKPEKGLVRPMVRPAGRDNYGHITVWWRGGGHKRKYRIIDFKRDKLGIPAKIASLEYDPNRSSFIALLNYQDGEKRYILAPNGVKVGETVVSDPNAEAKPGNHIPLKNIPLGTSSSPLKRALRECPWKRGTSSRRRRYRCRSGRCWRPTRRRLCPPAAPRPCAPVSPHPHWQPPARRPTR